MKKHILIVDDDSSVRESLKDLLQAAGYAVVLAADGQEGARRLEAGGLDLVVLDLNLPKLSGWDLLDLVREVQPGLPVLILSGLTDQCEPGSLLGVDAVLEKPPEVGVLMKVIDRLLTQPTAERLWRLSAERGNRRLLQTGHGGYLPLSHCPERWPGQVQPGSHL